MGVFKHKRRTRRSEEDEAGLVKSRFKLIC